MKKQEALEQLNTLFKDISRSAIEEANSLFSFKHNFKTIGLKCLDLKEMVESVDNEETEIIFDGNGIEVHIFDLRLSFEAQEGKSTKTLIGIWSAILLTIFALIIWRFDKLQTWLGTLFNVKDTAMYIVLGVLGAIIYFVMEGLLSTSSEEQATAGLTYRKMFAQLCFALLIPIVLVVVFFSQSESVDGSTTQEFVTNTAALICFAAGYSSKLVVLLLNKIVEKGENAIKAL